VIKQERGAYPFGAMQLQVMLAGSDLRPMTLCRWRCNPPAPFAGNASLLSHRVMCSSRDTLRKIALNESML